MDHVCIQWRLKVRKKIESKSNPVRITWQDPWPMMDERPRAYRTRTGSKEAAQLIKTQSTVWRIYATDHLTFSGSKGKPSLILVLSLCISLKKKKRNTNIASMCKEETIRSAEDKCPALQIRGAGGEFCSWEDLLIDARGLQLFQLADMRNASLKLTKPHRRSVKLNRFCEHAIIFTSASVGGPSRPLAAVPKQFLL